MPPPNMPPIMNMPPSNYRSSAAPENYFITMYSASKIDSKKQYRCEILKKFAYFGSYPGEGPLMQDQKVSCIFKYRVVVVLIVFEMWKIGMFSNLRIYLIVSFENIYLENILFLLHILETFLIQNNATEQ